MLYIIDYRNGSMGHTILAHALFACNQINVDVDTLFSANGDAHAVADLNQTKLSCNHELEDPTKKQSTQILSIVCTGWDEVLRKCMSYNKYFKSYPTENNLDTFGFAFNTNTDPLEYLSINYFDSYDIQPRIKSEVLHLGQYLDHRIGCLQQQVENMLGWEWDHSRSLQFYERMKIHNQQYLLWQQHIKSLVEQTLEKNVVRCDLKFWEKAIVISMACRQKNLHPSMLHWNDFKFLNNNNYSLIESIDKCNNDTA